MEGRVYLVPLIDVNWANFAPLDPKKNYLAERPPIEKCASEVERCVEEMKDFLEGKFVFSVHTGTYCRKAFYEEPFLGFYRKAVAGGAEICVHTHEERAGNGTLNQDRNHMRRVIRDRKRDLMEAGVTPNSYRGGHFAYMEYLTPFLEEEGLLIDLSSAPGVDKPAWDAVWVGAPFSAYYLCPENRSHGECGHPKSRVLEIPLGSDGLGSENINYFYVEESNDESLKGVWKALLGNGEAEGRPQFVHSLFHTSSMSMPEYVDRFRRFIEFARKNGGVLVAPSEAKRIYDLVGR